MCQSSSFICTDLFSFYLIPNYRKRIMSPPKKKNKKSRRTSKREGRSLILSDKIKKNSRTMKIGRNSERKRLSRVRDVFHQLYKEKSLKDQTNHYKDKQNNSLNATIDLCTDDSSFLCNNSVIDVSRSTELIDLTDIQSIKKKIVENGEPTVIDLSQEEEIIKKTQTNTESQKNDDIVVIGIYNKQSENTTPKKNKKSTTLPDFIPLSSSSNYANTIVNFVHKKNIVRKKNIGKKFNKNKYLESLIPNPMLAGVGENISIDAPISTPTNGLRPIIIDGSNVAFVNNKVSSNFSCKRLEICIKYFKDKGHKVTAFLPQFRMQLKKSDNPNLLRELEKQGDLIFTPSKRIDGKNIVPYDDRFIVQTAVLKGGVIVSRDNYYDLLKENPAWSETIKYRTLAFTWVDDVLMFPQDPLGEFGPSLEEFLRF